MPVTEIARAAHSLATDKGSGPPQPTEAASAGGVPLDHARQAIDQHVLWFAEWVRGVFGGDRVANFDTAAPAAFSAWCQATEQQGLLQQPALQRLTGLHEEMHRTARLILLRLDQTGRPPSRQELDGVVSRYEEFITRLRRIERAFATATAGLDALTGLRARRDMDTELSRELNRLRRDGTGFSVAMMDLDHFKAVNDKYGHEAGDRVLSSVGGLLTQTLRSFDDAFRFGGEEFLIVLKGGGAAEAVAVLERLRQRLEARPVRLRDGESIPVTASFGVAEAEANEAVDDLIARADQALYRAKQTGRNRVVVCGQPEPGTEPGTTAAPARREADPAPQAKEAAPPTKKANPRKGRGRKAAARPLKAPASAAPWQQKPSPHQD